MNGMDRAHLSDLDGRHSNVAVIGAGINGVGATQQLAAAGYSTLLVYTGSFTSGTSGGSSRILTLRLALSRDRQLRGRLAAPSCTLYHASLY